jgi:competence protein ComGC
MKIKLISVLIGLGFGLVYFLFSTDPVLTDKMIGAVVVAVLTGCFTYIGCAFGKDLMECSPRKSGKAGKGLAFVELLVVIAILAMLLAILMPAIAKVREKLRGNSNAPVAVQPAEQGIVPVEQEKVSDSAPIIADDGPMIKAMLPADCYQVLAASYYVSRGGTRTVMLSYYTTDNRFKSKLYNLPSTGFWTVPGGIIWEKTVEQNR